MTNEINKAEIVPAPEAPAATVSESQQMMNMIERVALDPNVDVEKLKAVLDMKEHIFDKNAEIAFNQAMSQVQSEAKAVFKSSHNDQTRSSYATMEQISRMLTPLYTKHGFALSYGSGVAATDGWFRITCLVSHNAGFSRDYWVDLPLDMSGIKGTTNKTAVHAAGSTMKYGQRYLATLIFNLTFTDAHDDDGNAASPMPLVTDEQAANIKAILSELGDKVEGTFLNWIRKDYNAVKIEEIPAAEYNRIIHKLEAKRNQA